MTKDYTCRLASKGKSNTVHMTGHAESSRGFIQEFLVEGGKGDARVSAREIFARPHPFSGVSFYIRGRHEMLTQRALFCIASNTKKGTLSQQFVTHVAPPLILHVLVSSFLVCIECFITCNVFCNCYQKFLGGSQVSPSSL